MGRITRAKAAEVAEALHIDEDAVLELDDENANLNIGMTAKELQLERPERAPLGELEANSADGKSQSDDSTPELRKSTRGKKAGKKGKKSALAASTASILELPDITDLGDAIPRPDDSTVSPASEFVATDLLKDLPASTPVEEPATNRAPSNPTTPSRDQLVTLKAEPKSLMDGIGQTPAEQEALHDEIVAISAAESMAPTTSTEGSDRPPRLGQRSNDAPASPLPTAVPKTIVNLRKDTPAKRSTSNKENVEPRDCESSQTINLDATDPNIPSSPPRPQDPITALDDLDDAVDSVTKDIPNVQTSPQKPRVRAESKKPAPVVRGTKASQARISLAQNNDAPAKTSSLGQPRPSTTTARANTIRPGATARPDLTARRAASSNTANSSKAVADRERKEVVIPHSKPRPVSLSFPTPPPPTKSTKAPTQSTFQLPGEAVAAKLKAAREARLQKDAEEAQKKPAFKARPVPATLSKAPTVRQTAASKARESIMASKDAKGGTTTNTNHKRASTVTIMQTKPRVPAATSKSTTLSSTPKSGDLAVMKRPSTVLANTSKPRSSPSSSTPNASAATQRLTTFQSKPRSSPSSSSNAPSTTAAAQRATTNPGKGTVKGKEVFNRPAAAKAAAEKEKQEKESAAKKARAEAAERGRQASREWAEKQRKLAAAKKASASTKADEVKIDSSEVQEGLVQSAPQSTEQVTPETITAEPVVAS